ncbi:hypothetical protein [Melittangium boletus]|uniref:hypothetical protein n=1 Tax=Melittangium boletus TaxID=83453 RepID=UPI003DA2BAC0
MTRLLAVLLVCLLCGACSHTQKAAELEALKTTVDDFHQRVRWKDYRVASRYVVPERRKEFDRGLRQNKDEQDLDITDYEIERVDLDEKGERATVTSHFVWTRLPSLSVRRESVTSEFVLREGKWLLEKQEGGPFDGTLP